MGCVRRQVIGVIGAPGAWTNLVGKSLVHNGAQVLWPEQDMLEGDQHLYDRNCENSEVNRIHLAVLSDCGEHRYSGVVPRFFDAPFPGPEQFLSKFLPDKPVAVIDGFMCLVWDIWSPYITDVVVVNAEEDVTRHFLRKYVDGNMTARECSVIFEVYLSQLQMVTNSFAGNRNHFYEIAQSAVQDGCCAELANSIIQATDGPHVG